MAALGPIRRTAAAESSSTAPSLHGMAGRCSTSSPIRELFHLHKAIRREVDQLHEAAIALDGGRDEDIAKLRDRHQFLYSVYKHHSNAEDEVILPALDQRVKNIAFAYSLEHEAESFLFQTLASLLESVATKTGEERVELLREIACTTEALKRSLHQHLYKEGEQVLPLLMKHLSFEEQSALVWQFMCCIPVSLLEEVIPWMAACLTWEERQEMVAHMRDMIPPQEELLQQVVSAWMMRRGTPPDLAIRWRELTGKDTNSSPSCYGLKPAVDKAERDKPKAVIECENGDSELRVLAGEPTYSEQTVEAGNVEGSAAEEILAVNEQRGQPEVGRSDSANIEQENQSSEGAVCSSSTGNENDAETDKGESEKTVRFPINEIIHFHNALRVELERFADEAKTMQLSGAVCQTALAALHERFRFLADVCFFHTTAEEEVVFPAVGKKVQLPVTYTEDHANEERLLTDVGRLIAGMQMESKNTSEEEAANRMIVELSLQAEAIATKVCQHFLNEESMVLPLVCQHFSMEEQREIMYQSLRAMPLRLLERVLPWVVALLSDEEASDMLRNMQLAAPAIDSALVELFSGWASRGRSRLCPDSPSGLLNSPGHVHDLAVTSGSECTVGIPESIQGITTTPSPSRFSQRGNDDTSNNGERPPKRQRRVDGGVDVARLSGLLSEIEIPSSNGNEERSCHDEEDDSLRGAFEIDALKVNMVNREPKFTNSDTKMANTGTVASAVDVQEKGPIRTSLSKGFDEEVMGVGHSRRTTGRGVLKDRVLRRKAVRMRSPKKPIDHIFQFHKAIRRDLEHLDYASTKLVECDDEALRVFSGRFHFLWGLYRAHSNAEDQIVFPALEAKEALHNVSHSYMLDHRQEEQLFKDIGQVLEKLSLVMVARREYERTKELRRGEMEMIEGVPEEDYYNMKHQALAARAQGMCKSVRISLDTHISSEEVELWPLFALHFSEEEQDKIVGRIIGSTGAEVLQAMLPWVTTALTQEEQDEMMLFFRQATRNTMFNKWLSAWWKDKGERYGHQSTPNSSPTPHPRDNSPPVGSVESLAVVARYLTGSKRKKDGTRGKVKKRRAARVVECESIVGQHMEHIERQLDDKPSLENEQVLRTNEETNANTMVENDTIYDSYVKAEEVMAVVAKEEQHQLQQHQQDEEGENEEEEEEEEEEDHEGDSFNPGWEQIFRMNQKELESAIRNVYSDKNLEPQRKAYLIQNLMTSRWIVAQQKMPHSLISDSRVSSGEELQDEDLPNRIAGRSRSYREEAKGIYGCEHYQRGCKLQAACCGQLFTCRFCHDKVSDHKMDRHATQEMMCMECLEIQPVGQYCATPSCNGRQMARYYCDICKFFDDAVRDIYHCPFCNLCRVGKGLGIDYFHCMKCNACMSVSLAVHTCREKGLESDCPICNDFLFTSNTPVKSLPCGHFMHSACYTDYTYGHYTCPICSKSLGDMAVYFSMLDALLEAEVMPEEYRHRTQDILCNDCGKKGKAAFHFVYHKCQHCNSYNTRTI